MLPTIASIALKHNVTNNAYILLFIMTRLVQRNDNDELAVGIETSSTTASSHLHQQAPNSSKGHGYQYYNE
ncbi:hypothetical protein EDC56_1759 [Sinobacterium caligoides]|uniref:Uncharacterized protein n=1 Tax=Sinobacterium caligoides TaxID=933926 RepID=A0A3N2DND8_9GAMM|nr:hypothetical protein EDC56_1759 [Sinobacterium caligoides]